MAIARKVGGLHIDLSVCVCALCRDIGVSELEVYLRDYHVTYHHFREKDTRISDD